MFSFVSVVLFTGVGPTRKHIGLFKLVHLEHPPNSSPCSSDPSLGPPPHHMNLFQGVHLDSRVHYVAHTSIGKRPVDLRLKGLLV